MYYFWLKKFLLSVDFSWIHTAIFCYTNTIVLETGLKRITEMIKKKELSGEDKQKSIAEENSELFRKTLMKTLNKIETNTTLFCTHCA